MNIDIMTYASAKFGQPVEQARARAPWNWHSNWMVRLCVLRSPLSSSNSVRKRKNHADAWVNHSAAHCPNPHYIILLIFLFANTGAAFHSRSRSLSLNLNLELYSIRAAVASVATLACSSTLPHDWHLNLPACLASNLLLPAVCANPV